VFAKHLMSFWLVDSLAIGVDRMKHNFGADAKVREKRGSIRDKGIDGGRHRRGGLLPVGRPTGNYSIRAHKGVTRPQRENTFHKRKSAKDAAQLLRIVTNLNLPGLLMARYMVEQH